MSVITTHLSATQIPRPGQPFPSHIPKDVSPAADGFTPSKAAEALQQLATKTTMKANLRGASKAELRQWSRECKDDWSFLASTGFAVSSPLLGLAGPAVLSMVKDLGLQLTIPGGSVTPKLEGRSKLVGSLPNGRELGLISLGEGRMMVSVSGGLQHGEHWYFSKTDSIDGNTPTRSDFSLSRETPEGKFSYQSSHVGQDAAGFRLSKNDVFTEDSSQHTCYETASEHERLSGQKAGLMQQTDETLDSLLRELADRP